MGKIQYAVDGAKAMAFYMIVISAVSSKMTDVRWLSNYEGHTTFHPLCQYCNMRPLSTAFCLKIINNGSCGTLHFVLNTLEEGEQKVAQN
jgi:hypothetical protein